MERLFCYGTLEFPLVMRRVTGRVFHGEPAVLSGFARRPVRGERYPGITRAEGARVRGTLYRDIDERMLRALDRYETTLYRRCLVPVRDARGRLMPAWTYVTREAACLAEGEWDPALFERRHMAAYLRELDVAPVAPRAS